VALASAVTLSDTEYAIEFGRFMATHNKAYATADEQGYRFRVFKNNLDFINNHNAAKKSFTVAVNAFADLTIDEFTSRYLGVFNRTRTPTRLHKATNLNALPDTVDWRTKGAVTPVKDQGQCGSCWSFSATGSMEGAVFLKTGKLPSLSEQNLVDCSTSQGNDGCGGGLMDYAFDYVISNKGIDSEVSYPYTATGPNTCEFKKADVAATISSYHDVSSGSESDLQSAVAQQPTSVAIDASHSSFQFYSSGVYNEPACSSTQLDHGVLAVGYGTDNGKAYWLVKNSWAATWGNKGYIEMSRNANNQCGIATAASYPIV
jgi:cathepsin L